MKTLYTLICLVLISASLNAQVGIGTNTPDASSMLEVNSSTKGFLPPRVSLTSTSSASPVTSPATGLLVYNTATASDVVPGIYFWNGTAWKKLDVDTRASQFTTSGSNVYYNTGSVGLGTATPDASSILEISSANKGFLPPRVSLTSTSSASPVTSPATGLVVFNTATVSDVVPGIYFWNGTAWKKLDVDTRASQFTTSGSNVYYNTGSVGLGTATPDASSVLEISSSTKGFLPPRVALTGTSSASPVTSPATGLVVFNTATASDVVPGIYFWNGTAWKKLDVDTRSSQFTTSGSNIYYSTGNVGIGTSTPATTLDVNGSATVSGSLNGGNSATSTISGFAANISAKSASYTLVAADNGKILNFTNSTAVTVTIPTGLPAGFNCTVVQNGAGQITFAASGTTVNNRNGFTKTAGLYSMVSILNMGSNAFITSGEMSN